MHVEKLWVLSSMQLRIDLFAAQALMVFGFLIFEGNSNAAKSMTLFSELTNEPFTLSISPSFLAILVLVVLIGVVVFVIFLFQYRTGHRSQIIQNYAELKRNFGQLESILESDNQNLLVIWFDRQQEPRIFGKFPEKSEVPKVPKQFLEFENWLIGSQVSELRALIAILQNDGEPFDYQVETVSGVKLNVTGKTVGGSSLLRLRRLTSEKSKQLIASEVGKFEFAANNFLFQFLDTWSGLSWIRNEEGKLIWVNDSFCKEVGAKDLEEVVAQTPALIVNLVNQKNAISENSGSFFGRVAITTDSTNRIYEVCECESNKGIIGFATATEGEHSKEIETSQLVKIPQNSLNYLSIAVAIFNAEQHLVYFNDAYKSLWEFDDEFLNGKPTDSEILNTLRVRRKLPEQTDFRDWRNDILTSYLTTEVRDFYWYLPDSRTLRVFVIPRENGGVIYFYENVTEQIRFESRVNAMNRVQGETLDHLSDAVSVFGSNGRLRLWNPTFAELWQQESKFLNEFPHISEISQRINLGKSETKLWNKFAAEVTQVSEVRTNVSGQIERKDGVVLDYAIAPLPDSSMLVTFVDVTDSIHVERALTDKNEALRQADELKNNFIQHISYEFRSPLTSIIGFAQMLSDPKLGTLTSKQSEYMEHILASSSALLALIDDILDLATIDAGIMELDLVDVDIQETIKAVTEGVNDRLINSNVELEVHLPKDVGTFVADQSRIRQILFNLVSNAINFSTDSGKVAISCERLKDRILFKIQDNGIGIPKEYLPKVFENFVSWGKEEKRRGVGLGLPIVKRFVEMHGGQVTVESKEGEGTQVTVSLPLVANPTNKLENK